MNFKPSYLVISIQERSIDMPLVMVRYITANEEVALEAARNLQNVIGSDKIEQIEIHLIEGAASKTLADYMEPGDKAIIIYKASRMGSRGSPRFNLWTEWLYGCYGNFNLLPLVGIGLPEVPKGKFWIIVLVDSVPKLVEEISDLQDGIEMFSRLKRFHDEVDIYDHKGKISLRNEHILAGSN